MKIIIATPLYPPEIKKLSVYAKTIGEKLTEKHEEITIVAYASTSEKIQGAKLVTINKNQPLLLRFLKYVTVLLREAVGADIIYAQSAVVSGLPAIIVKKFLNTPVVINFTDDEAWKEAVRIGVTRKNMEEFLIFPSGGKKIKLLLRLQKFVLKNAEKIMAPNFQMAEIIARRYNLSPEKIFVNYEPAEKEEIIPFSAEKEDNQIVAMGKQNSLNGMDNIIRAISIVKKNREDVKLLIVGDGPEKSILEKITNKLDIRKNVVFVGNVSGAENWHIIKTSRLIMLTGDDGYSLDGLRQGLSAGTVVIAPDLPDIAKIITDMKDGVIIDFKDERKIATTIEQILKDKKLQEKITSNGRKILSEKFTWEKHLNNLNIIFKSVLDGD